MEYNNHLTTDNGNTVDNNSNSNHFATKPNTRTDRNQKSNKNKTEERTTPNTSKNLNENEITKTRNTKTFNPEVVLDPENKGVMTQGDRLNAIKARKHTQSLQGGAKVANMKNVLSGDQSHTRVKSVPAPLAFQAGAGGGRGSSSTTLSGNSNRTLITL